MMFFISHDLASRDRHPELMDQPGLSSAEHRRALAGLARINRLSFSARALWRPIAREMRRQPARQWRLLDVACGSGDVPLTLARSAASAGLLLSVAGCDMSPTAIGHANERARDANVNADFFQRDVVRNGIPDAYDFVTCSLFLHHLDEIDIVSLLRAIGDAATVLGVASDLRRTHLGYALAVAGSRLLSRSRIVHVDGPLSVRAALTSDEIGDLAKAAGLDGRITTRHIWPQRFLLTIGPPR